MGPARIVEHLLLAARGGASEVESSAFTGRVAEVDQVVGWVTSGVAGVHVVTGSAGTGKSAVVGRVVSWSDPGERARLVGEGAPIGHADPGVGSVQAQVHARGLTVARVAALVDEQLVAAGVLGDGEGRNANQLVGDLQRVGEAGGSGSGGGGGRVGRGRG